MYNNDGSLLLPTANDDDVCCVAVTFCCNRCSLACFISRSSFWTIWTVQDVQVREDNFFRSY